MTKKGILITFVTTTIIIGALIALGYAMIVNQPSADTFYATIPGKPSWAPSATPSTPVEPRLAGDVSDDGIINALDINAIIIHWREKNLDYNLADSGDAGVIDRADIAQVFSYFGCYELKTNKNCPYLSGI
jgi:hypothetical protein